MSDFLDLAATRVGIMGLGLMGGSLAMALRGRCRMIVGVDTDSDVVIAADTMGVIDVGAVDLSACHELIDLLILAIPVRAILAQIPRLPAIFPGALRVMDVGSTKKAVMAAFESLPSRFDVLGGHPMCGKAQGGFAHAEAGLYQGAPFALVREPSTSDALCALGEAVAAAVGARPLWLSAVAHDLWTAGTSHLPYLISCALAGATPEAFVPMIGPGFRSVTRLADTPLSMMGDILTTNRENILNRMEHFLAACQQIRVLLASSDADALFQRLEDYARHHQALIQSNQTGGQDAD